MKSKESYPTKHTKEKQGANFPPYLIAAMGAGALLLCRVGPGYMEDMKQNNTLFNGDNTIEQATEAATDYGEGTLFTLEGDADGAEIAAEAPEYDYDGIMIQKGYTETAEDGTVWQFLPDETRPLEEQENGGWVMIDSAEEGFEEPIIQPISNNGG